MRLRDVVGQHELCAETRRDFVKSSRLLMLTTEGEYDLSLQLALRRMKGAKKGTTSRVVVDTFSESRECHLCLKKRGSTNFCFWCGASAPPLPNMGRVAKEKRCALGRFEEFSKLAYEDESSEEFAGDLIFLMRNLCHSSLLFGDDRIALESSHRLAEMMAAYRPALEDMDEILNAVEALHVFAQLRADPLDIPLPEEIRNILCEKSFGEEEKIAKRRRGAWTRESLRASIQDRLRVFSVIEALGYDPTSHTVPYIDWGHCSNCGREQQQSKKVKKKESCCVECGIPLEERIDFAALTDGLVWTYLFRELGISGIFSDSIATLDDVLVVLPQARRSYQDREAAGGDDFFRLQCYFVTHLVYVASDWGRHLLRPDLFRYELDFLNDNLKYVLDDTELAGEFLHCLRILGGCGTEDAVVQLLKTKKSTMTKYDRYHTAYCAAVGLLSLGESRKSPRTPSLFK